jgi:hypothetical protein
MFSVSRVFSHLAKVRFCGGAARAPTASPSFLAVRRRVGWEDGHATRATVERRRVEDAEGWLGGSSEGDAGRRRPNSVHMSMTQPPLILEWLRFYRALERGCRPPLSVYLIERVDVPWPAGGSAQVDD